MNADAKTLLVAAAVVALAVLAYRSLVIGRGPQDVPP
jgi:hypothetical protein